MLTLKLGESRRLFLSEHEQKSTLCNKDVEVSIVMTGICGTDLAVLSGREEGATGIIRGHEAVGIITAIGAEVTQVKIGDRVVIDPNQYCGECSACRRGDTNLCEGHDGGLAIAGVNIHGTFAERFVCDQRFVHRLPAQMSWEAAVLIEPVACVLHTLEKGGLRAQERLLLIGCGPMSLVAQLVCKRMGIQTVALEKNPHRLAFTRDLGLEVMTPDDLPAEARFDAVLDSSGNQLALATRHLVRGGRILLFGFDQHYRFELPVKHFLVNALSVIGAGEYNQHFPAAIAMAAALPELARLVTHKYALAEYEAAIAGRFDPKDQAIKTVFEMPV